MTNVLFFDPTAKYPYTSKTLMAQAMGASEASLMRIARALARDPAYSVSVFQVVDQSRRELVIEGVRHVNGQSTIDPDVIIHQRTAKFVEAMREQYPKARHIVWMHDLGHESWLKDQPDMLQEVPVVCVSKWHAQQMAECFITRFSPWDDATNIVSIYNPIELDGAVPAPKVAGRLGFFSSPQKGLKQVVEAFLALKVARPELELVVANPGYLADEKPEGVTFLGQLPHPLALKELSKCEVLFYPQTVFPETFGCVLAEANAMGVPVLCHDFGAAREVLLGENNLNNCVTDCTDLEHVSERLGFMLSASWGTRLDPRFEIGNIVSEWKQLLEGAV